MRGNPAWLEMMPKLALLTCLPPAWNFGLFVALSASRRICVCIEREILTVLASTTSKFVRNGLRIRVSARGAVPNVKGAAATYAAGLM